MTRKSTKLRKYLYYRKLAYSLRCFGYTLRKLVLLEDVNRLALVDWEVRNIMKGRKNVL